MSRAITCLSYTAGPRIDRSIAGAGDRSSAQACRRYRHRRAAACVRGQGGNDHRSHRLPGRRRSGATWPCRKPLTAGWQHDRNDLFNVELAAKRLELLRELVPWATRIAVLVNPADAGITETTLKEVQAAARAMGLQIRVYNADSSAGIDAAFETMGHERPDAIFVGTTPFLNGRRVQLAQLAAFYRLPATYALRDYAQAGGLMSYGSDIIDGYRQLGIYTGRLLRGTNLRIYPVPLARSNSRPAARRRRRSPRRR